jgi:hypothetical protein
LASLEVLGFSSPSLDGTVLQGSAIGEADVPRATDARELVHLVEVKGSIFFTLAA